MSDKVTRCPNCLVAFKVSQAQLQAANGLARCGACLTIFDARKQLTDLPQGLETGEDAASMHSNPGDDFLIDDNFDPDNLEEIPASAAENNEEGEPATETGDSRQGARKDKAFGEIFEPLPETLHLPVWLQDARQDSEVDLEDSPSVGIGATSSATAAVPPRNLHSDATTSRLDSIGDDPQASDPYAGLAPADAPLFDDDETHGRAATQLDSRMPPVLLKTGIIALGALALLVQYLYFNMDVLGRNVAQRPWLEKFCRVLQCDLPALKDTSLIRNDQLVVRTHPDAKGALLVSAVLVNDAPFQQPFPDLQLVFQDLQGAVVAKRSFLPEEYLRGELTGASRMPVRQPIRLELEILDPGETAVSFALYIP